MSNTITKLCLLGAGLSLGVASFAQVVQPNWSTPPNYSLTRAGVFSTHNGNIVVAASNGLFLVDPLNGNIIRRIGLPGNDPVNARSLSVHPDFNIVAVGRGPLVQVIDIITGGVLASANPGVGNVTSTAFLPNGSLGVVGSNASAGLRIYTEGTYSFVAHIYDNFAPAATGSIESLTTIGTNFCLLVNSSGNQPRAYVVNGIGLQQASFPFGVVNQHGLSLASHGAYAHIGTNNVAGNSRIQVLTGGGAGGFINRVGNVTDAAPIAFGGSAFLVGNNLEIANIDLSESSSVGSVSPRFVTFAGNRIFTTTASFLSAYTHTNNFNTPPALSANYGGNHIQSLARISVSPDGQRVAASSFTGRFQAVYTSSTGSTSWTLSLAQAGDPWIRQVRFSPDSTRLAAGVWPLSGPSYLRITDTSGNNPATFDLPANLNIRDIQYRNNSEVGVAAGDRVYIHNVDGTPLSQTPPITSLHFGLSFSPDASRFAVAAQDALTVNLYQAGTSPVQQSVVAVFGTKPIWRNDNRIFVGSGNQLRSYDANNLAAGATIHFVAQSDITSIAASIFQDYFYVASGNRVEKIYIPTGRLVGVYNAIFEINDIEEVPNEQRLIVGLADGSVQSVQAFNRNVGDSIYWEGPNSGPLPRLMVIWQIRNSSVVLPSIVIDVAPADWQVRAVGNITNITADGLVWQNTNPGFSIPGLIAFWGVSVSGTPFPLGTGGAPPSFDWQIRAFTDMNGDAIPDFVWVNVASGEVAIWYRNLAGNILSTKVVGVTPAGWRVVTAMDVAGAGVPAVWFQNNTTSQVAYWQLNGAGNIQSTKTIGTPGAQWQMEGIGRFNLNAPAILFRNTSTNQLAYWNFSWQGLVTSTGTIGFAPADWKIIGIGNLD
ncbi:MAG: hypothetical protein ACK4P3_01030 [Fimbriimonadaceae bacterium]